MARGHGGHGELDELIAKGEIGQVKLICVSDYRSGAGSYSKGQVIEDNEALCEFLLRDSPGSFEVEGEMPKIKAAPEPDLSAMSTATQTGIVAPDRRARGGRRR